jgi:hypothetical protein
MKLLAEHFYVTFLIGCVGWALSGNFYCVPSALIAGWFVDLDHLCDYLFCCIKTKKINLKHIITGEYFKINNKIIVPLHAWEISTLVLLVGILIPEHRATLITAAIAHAAHLLQDQWTYRVHLCGYSFTSRMIKGFAYKNFCRIENG